MTYSATKRDGGSIAALGAVFADLAHFIAFRVAHLREFIAALPLHHVGTENGVLFVGYIEAGLGLGESLRGLIRSVATTGLPFAVYPFNIGVETRFIGQFAADLYDMRRRYRVNVVEMSADQVPAMFRELGVWKTAHSYNILRTYWELPHAPAEWAFMLKGIQEIWAPNQFVENAFRRIFTGPIRIVPPCVEVETDTAFDRDYFGIDHHKFYFVFSFDYFSHPARKNPLAVVRAFQQAFPELSENVALIIKSTGAPHHGPKTKSAILAAAASDPRIMVIDRMCSRDEVLSLIRSADCYVSLHRSEGFGLGMAEAMASGKPVIGTNYSGNTDFLSDLTGFPVSFSLRPVQAGEYIFSDGQSWAEPDEAAAAEAMRQVFFNPRERQQRAASGKALVEARYSRENVGQIATRYLEDILATRNLHRKPKR